MGKQASSLPSQVTGPGIRCQSSGSDWPQDGPDDTFSTFHHPAGAIDMQVEGLQDTLSMDAVSIQYVNACLRQTGDFACSNPYLDTLFEVAMRTHRNYVNDFPADPNREKQGWTQDVQNMFHTAAYFTDVA